jgi:predicted ribosomally synthesized peptide with nif11-like leader
MSTESFEKFRQHVLLNPRLQEVLRSEREHMVFAPHVVKIGKEAGFEFSEADVVEALSTNRRLWLERWLW